MNVSGIGFNPAYKKNNNNMAFKTNLAGLKRAENSVKLEKGEKILLIEIIDFFTQLEKQINGFFEYSFSGKNDMSNEIANIKVKLNKGEVSLADLDKYWSKDIGDDINHITRGQKIKEILLKTGMSKEDADFIKIGTKTKELVA